MAVLKSLFCQIKQEKVRKDTEERKKKKEEERKKRREERLKAKAEQQKEGSAGSDEGEGDSDGEDDSDREESNISKPKGAKMKKSGNRNAQQRRVSDDADELLEGLYNGELD